jgi:hypothetical protein
VHRGVVGGRRLLAFDEFFSLDCLIAGFVNGVIFVRAVLFFAWEFDSMRVFSSSTDLEQAHRGVFSVSTLY